MVLGVLGNINYTKYSNTKNITSTILTFLLKLIGNLLLVTIIYFIITKLFSSFNDKLSNISIKFILISIAIGLRLSNFSTINYCAFSIN